MLTASTFALPLPSHLSATSIGSFAHDVRPFLPQLTEFPSKVLAALSHAGSSNTLATLTEAYVSTNPAVAGLGISLALAPVFLAVSEATGNYSQVDRCWSILPTFYIAHYYLWARLAGLPTTRLLNALGLACLWTGRLTYNYWRKGGYTKGSEDYRWEILKKYIPKPLWFVFNVTFISTIQSILLWSVTTPIYNLLLATPQLEKEWDVVDMVFSRILVLMNGLIYISDQQQWNFQTAKKIFNNSSQRTVPPPFTRTDLSRGFLVRGLWAFSRHPNFAAEQAVWFFWYVWGAYQTSGYYNWTVWGTFSYLCLFQGSTYFTEWVTGGKYEEYKVYKKNVPMFVPKPWTLFNRPFGKGEGKTVSPVVDPEEEEKKKEGEKGL